MILIDVGFYECYKISQIFNIKMMISCFYFMVEYFVEGVGVVWFEIYDQCGKL